MHETDEELESGEESNPEEEEVAEKEDKLFKM